MANSIHIGGGGSGSATLITKSITQNGTYLAQDDNADGYSEVSVDVAGREVDKVYFQNTFSRGDTPLTLTLLETANKTSHIKLTGSVWAPSIPTGYTATTGTISNNRFTTTETSEYHWDYVQEFDITCGNDNAVIVYNGELNFKSEVSLNVYHIYNLAPKTITQNGTYLAQDDNADGYSEVSVDVAGGVEYVDISDFAFYYRKNTSTPTVTPISSTEVSLTYQDQNNTGYELSSYSVSLEKGIYVAEIYATLDKNTGLAGRYTWGIYSSNTSGGASMNDNSPLDNTAYDTYVPFDKSDTNEHYYEVPIKVLADGTAYICFAMADDNGVNATITVRSLKIRKAYGSAGDGIDYLESWIINSKSAVTHPTTTTHLVYTNGSISTFENADNAGNETVTLGDISTFIGDASGFYWCVTANANMTYRIYNVLTGTLGELQTATSGTRIISDGPIDTDYCMEIRRYS